jgi:uncharacterized protein (DUF983 family)
MSAHDHQADRPLGLGVSRGLRMRCPDCGEGALFRSYLKVKPCNACGHRNDAYRADDGPAYVTILLVGHLVIAPLLLWPFIWEAPLALVLGTIIPAIGVLTLAALPVVKGGWVGLMWSRHPHS